MPLSTARWPNLVQSRVIIPSIFVFFIVYGSVSGQEASDLVQLSPIIVTPGKFTILGGAKSVVTLTKREIESLPLIDNDVARAAHIFPGVVSNEYSARFSVRGGEKDEILVRLDGMELYEPYHLQDFGGAVSIIDLGLIRHADLLMGGFPAEYGDRLSGVYDLHVMHGNREEFSANLGVDLINAHMLLEGPLSDRGSWLVSARRGYLDIILNLMGADEELKPQYADVYGKITYDLTSQDTLSVNSLYAWDKNRIREEDDESNLDSRYQNAMVWTKWRHHFNEEIWSDVFLFNGLVTRDRQEGVNGIDTRDFGYLGSKAEITARLVNTHTLRAGLEWRWSAADYNYSVPTYGQITTQFIQSRCSVCDLKRKTWAKVDAHGTDVKGYLQDEWQLHPKLAVNAGVRLLFQNYRKEGTQGQELSPRVALAYRATENIILRSAWGFYHQPTDLTTIPVEDGEDDIGRAEQATHYVIGGDYVVPNRVLIRAEAYHKRLANLIGHIPDYGRQARIVAPAHSGSAKGIDLFVNGVISDRMTGSLGYAFLIAKAR
ncbi:MAG: TonB-dependent receptor, partial [Candidatus Poribacteria bacterium]|nr:TonB-dependent receptor [Candidatus Poribacteria bacterium]